MEYEIQGGAFPIVICTLQRGETMKNETGAMSFMTSEMKMETNTGGGLLKGLGRALSGDSIFLNFFTAQADNQKIGFSARDIYFRNKIGTGIFGGEGFVLQKFSGVGMAFIEIDGEVIERELAPGEQLLLDPGHLAAMDESVGFDIERVKGAKNILFGEGLFFARLTGPGKVWIQTMPISKLAQAIIPFLPTSNVGGDGLVGALFE